MESIKYTFGRIAAWPQQFLLILIQAYRYLLSPWLGQHCRFHPTCSCYAMDAIKRFGAIAGVVLMVKRIMKCHPWHEGGYDPVPGSDESKSR